MLFGWSCNLTQLPINMWVCKIRITQFSCVLVFLSFTFLPFSMSVIFVFQTPFGLIRMTIVVVPFLYVGTLISKNFAALLEEHDIFVPEDDDDDDWAIFIKIYGKVFFSLMLLVILTTNSLDLTLYFIHVYAIFLLPVKAKFCRIQMQWKYEGHTVKCSGLPQVFCVCYH